MLQTIVERFMIAHIGITIVMTVLIYKMFLAILAKKAKSIKLYKHIVYITTSHLLSCVFVAIVVMMENDPKKFWLFSSLGFVQFVSSDIALWFMINKFSKERRSLV